MAKTKLTPELQELILAFLREGNYDRVAAQACGISRQTFYRWIRIGKEEKKEPYFSFWNAIEQAKAEGEVALLKTIKTASDRKWTAAAWILERSRPERYSKYRAKEAVMNDWEEDVIIGIKKGDLSQAEVENITKDEELVHDLFKRAGVAIVSRGEDAEATAIEEPAKPDPVSD